MHSSDLSKYAEAAWISNATHLRRKDLYRPVKGTRTRLLWLLLTTAGCLCNMLGQDKIYWTEDLKVMWSNLDGSDAQLLIDKSSLQYPNHPRSRFQVITIDTQNGFLYWTGEGIHRARLDGSQAEDLDVGVFPRPHGIAVDPQGGRLFWTVFDRGRIMQAKLDGSDASELLDLHRSPLGLVFDAAGQKLYWSLADSRRIRRADADGQNQENDFLQLFGLADGIALDASEHRLYWIDSMFGRIQSVDLDDSGKKIDTLLVAEEESARPTGIALNEGRLYWTDPGLREIRSAQMDGTDVKTVLSTSGLPRYLAVFHSELKQRKLLFPHFADGQELTSELVLTNPLSVPVNVMIEARTPGGDLLEIELGENLAEGGSLEASIAAGGMLSLRTSGQGDGEGGTRTGSLAVLFDYNLSASLSLSGNGLMLAFPPAPLLANGFTVAVKHSEQEERTSVALLNVGSDSLAVDFELLTDEGSSLTDPVMQTLTLAPDGQTAIYVDDLFEDFFMGRSDFRGLLRATFTTDQPQLAAVAVQSGPEGAMDIPIQPLQQ